MAEEASGSMVWATAFLLLAFMGVTLFFVIRGALRIKNIDDYALGSIAFSPVAIGLALAASMTSAATFIINPGIIALFGISGVITYCSFGVVGGFNQTVSQTWQYGQIANHGSVDG